jgi:hypothetical protein
LLWIKALRGKAHRLWQPGTLLCRPSERTDSEEIAMRLFFLSLAVLTAAMAAGSGTAAAQNYPWCAYYAGDFGGTNCGFSTYEQCLATISGIGGSCERNTQYLAPSGPRATPVHRRRRHTAQP